MHGSVSPALLSELSKYLSDHIGLFFPEKRWSELEHKMLAAKKDFNFDNVEQFIRWLLSAPLTRHQVEILAEHLTVKETYFFREEKTFEALEHTILPELIREKYRTEKRIRIWSAGCSTGEEPYSIAILLTRLIPDIHSWNISILGTDINPGVLRTATEGVYSDWSFRDTPSWIKNQYFTRINRNGYAVIPRIKNMVTFSYLNLSEDTFPSLSTNTNAMDIILCRNVLMYFARESIKAISERFYHSLLDNGWFIVSVVETFHIFSSRFTSKKLGNITLYRRQTGKDENLPKAPPEYRTPEIPGLAKTATVPRRKPTVRKRETPRETEQPEITPFEKAKIFYQKGKYTDAENILLDLVGKDESSAKTSTLLARVLANQGKLEEARQWAERAIRHDKLNPASYYLLGMILEEQKDTDGAEKMFKKALYVDNDYVLAHFALGNLSMRLGKHTESKKHLRNTMELLSRHKTDETLPESEGITAGRLTEMLRSTNP